MQSSRLIFFFKIWAVVFATTLYFAQAIIAQSPEQRLIRLLEPVEALNADETTIVNLPLEQRDTAGKNKNFRKTLWSTGEQKKR